MPEELIETDVEPRLGVILPELLKREEAAEYLHVHINTLDNLIKSGRLPAVRVTNRKIMIRADELQEYLNKNSTAPPIQEWEYRGGYQGDEEE